ncbi:UNVERIFIED_CONTAM: hypothetical protein GTU68_001091 [Idotea baltica]|nr:hypothetical protein [Idotea baltica]
MKNEGYTTFYAGKYLNQYGMDSVGGLSHIPPGWDSWIGLKGNSVYYNYTLSINGTPIFHSDDPQEDYLTNIIKDEGVKFIQETSGSSSPFFMMLSAPACHDPITPEPKYEQSLLDLQIPETNNFNIANGEDKNWFVRLGEQPLKDNVIEDIEEMYRNRLRTLMSVDDMIEAVVQALDDQNNLNNTYIFFTSDNGYHLGQFSLAKDKREPYEFDIRVPLMVRSPGIEEGVQIESVATNIDLAPTFLDLAGISVPNSMDGMSLKNFILGMDVSSERTILIEHTGEGSQDVNSGCEYLGTGLAYCLPELDCKCQDALNNTYSCLRTLGNGKNEKFCKWNDDEQFEEYYDIGSDPYELNNEVNNLNNSYYDNLENSLNYMVNCSGNECLNIYK